MVEREVKAMSDPASSPPKRTGKACPICGKPALVSLAPFCSKRCADIDLHRWLGGVYAVPASEEDEDLASGETDPAA